MTQVALLTSAARNDLFAAARWIAKDSPAAARALRQSAIRAAKLIGEHPQIGAERLDIVRRPYRVFSLTGFPYVMIYNSGRTPPVIIRVIHGARDLAELMRDL